ncbi:outer membrane protein assembly factor BamA [Candidatus Pelagibacter sp. HIMB123]|uniref:outer membrane protein assembly factor BamA n=1 Tax=Candidatus Pelagibacter sp. HIMB123 TaxID=3415413 RepID=UPI003F87116B
MKSASTEIVKSIEILGNERIADETILMFSKIKIGSDLDKNDINNSLKFLYESNFFENVSINLIQNNLTILVKENPIIENITFDGIKSNTLKEKILKDLNIKARSSYNEILLKETKSQIISSLRDLGYYFAGVDIDLIDLDDNKIDLIFKINLGEKAKIKKITFIGNKIFKDSKLKSLIASEEYKFWKIISGKKYLNENLINFDTRLLRNFYLNKGYYDVDIKSSYAKLINNDEFEVIFNIDAKNKFYFDNLNLDLPIDFETSNFENLNTTFKSLKNKPYSINYVEKILNEIDKIAISEQYESISANVIENIVDDKINLTFKIDENEKYFIKKINIFGNNITRENVIRNQFYIDEGDPYNEILAKKSINEIKSLNFFKNVESQIIDDDINKTKIINITVEEKPTGEIMAGAGFGTDGEVIEFGIKENNYLGKGLKVETNLSVGSDKIVGNFDLRNPNINNTDKSANLGIRASEIDRLTDFGYKSKKIGGLIGTKFEYLEDFSLGLEASSFIEDISTSSSASARQKKQEGDYFDTYVGLNFDYDKRNQKFQTNDGFRSFYSIDMPIISDTNTLTNFYNYKVYSELYENNISSLSFSLSSANSLTGDDIKLSERLYIPQKRLRGFVKGKVGPKDGSDYIGGNYYTTLNLSSTLPQVLPNLENISVSSFVDIGNVWGVDDSSLDDSSKLRSSIGIGVDYFTIVGPLSFTFAQPITKADTDAEETFRFNLGTTF